MVLIVDGINVDELYWERICYYIVNLSIYIFYDIILFFLGNIFVYIF